MVSAGGQDGSFDSLILPKAVKKMKTIAGSRLRELPSYVCFLFVSFSIKKLNFLRVSHCFAASPVVENSFAAGNASRPANFLDFLTSCGVEGAEKSPPIDVARSLNVAGNLPTHGNLNDHGNSRVIGVQNSAQNLSCWGDENADGNISVLGGVDATSLSVIRAAGKSPAIVAGSLNAAENSYTHRNSNDHGNSRVIGVQISARNQSCLGDDTDASLSVIRGCTSSSRMGNSVANYENRITMQNVQRIDGRQEGLEQSVAAGTF